MHSKSRSLFIKTTITIIVLLIGYLFVLFQLSNSVHQKILLNQATQHISTLAKGSVDDLLTRDYGDLENWVMATAAADEYAYAYIKSSTGIILLHSDLHNTGQQHKPLSPPVISHSTTQYKSQPVLEINYPITLEGDFFGSAHLAYYTRAGHQNFVSTYLSSIILSLVLAGLLIAGSYFLIRLVEADD